MAKINMPARELGERIRKIRRYKGYKETDMAERLGVSQRQYSRYENGETLPTPEKLAEVCQILEVSEEFLRNFDDRMVFTNCTGSMGINNNNVYHNSSEKERELYEEQIRQLKEENDYLRKHKDEEIAYLREQLKASLAR